MMDNKFKLYILTDSKITTFELIKKIKEIASTNCVDFIQLRRKNSSYELLKYEASIIFDICKSHNIKFIINDNINLFNEINADGIHLGQNDLKEINFFSICKSKILGISVKNYEEALKAIELGASYIAISSVNPTNTKTDADLVEFNEILKICNNINNIPIYLIGGLNTQNIYKYIDIPNICGFCFVSEIFNSNNITKTLLRLKSIINN